MAARKQLWHPDAVREKIKASQLVNRLTDHALSNTPIMDASQVTAATKLLNKVLPDLASTTFNGSLDIMTQTKEQRDAAVAAATRADA